MTTPPPTITEPSLDELINQLSTIVINTPSPPSSSVVCQSSFYVSVVNDELKLVNDKLNDIMNAIEKIMIPAASPARIQQIERLLVKQCPPQLYTNLSRLIRFTPHQLTALGLGLYGRLHELLGTIQERYVS